MNSFKYQNPTKLIFCLDALDSLATEAEKIGDRILLHYGQNSIKRSGLYDRIIEIFETNNIQYFELGGVKSNPSYDLVEEGIKLCKENKIDAVLAVGGGSVIDSSKAIAAGTLYEGNFEDAFYYQKPIEQALNVGVVLTIPGSGSESSKGAVISIRNNAYKRDILSDAIIPKFAIINPSWFTTLKKEQAAAGISDIFAHLLERYFSPTEHVDFTDRMLEAAMRTIIHHGPLVIQDLNNINAWSEIALVSTIAHNNLLDSGRLSDWASHKIEHEVSGKYDTPHGLGLSIIFPAWMKYASKINPKKFNQFSNRIWNIDYAQDQVDLNINKGILAYTKFLKELGLPTTFREASLEINEEIIDELVYKCFEARQETFGNYVKIDKIAMKEILLLAQ